MKKIFLLGSNGFVGRNIYENLSKQYHIFRYSKNSNLLLDLKKFKPNIIINCAGETSDSNKMFDSNILLVYKILSFCKNNKDIKLIHIGSGKEYDCQKYKLKENSNLNYNNIYESTKCSGSLLCYSFAKYYKLPVIIIRPFSIYGKYQNKNNLISKLIDASINGGTVNVCDGKNDFIYIKDFLNGIKTFCDINNEFIIGGDIVNFCSGNAYSNRYVVKIIKSIFGNKANIQYSNHKNKNKFRIGNPAYCKKKYGFYTKFNLKSGLTNLKNEI